MNDQEFLRRLHAAYFHLQALAEHLRNKREHPIVVVTNVLAEIYRRACSEQGVNPWDIEPWSGPANRSWERAD